MTTYYRIHFKLCTHNVNAHTNQYFVSQPHALNNSLYASEYARRRPGEEFRRECVKPTVKHGGGKIMVWGCVSGAGGMGKLKRIEGKVDAAVYYRILRHQMAPTMTRQGGRKSFIFMQENATVLTATKIHDFFEQNG